MTGDTITIEEALLVAAKGMSEKEFQSRVIAEAELNNWLVYHQFDVGWKDNDGKAHYARRVGKGFPDLVMVRQDKGVIYAELKSEKGKLTSDQGKWRDVLINLKERWYLWRPSDINEILEVLK